MNNLRIFVIGKTNIPMKKLYLLTIMTAGILSCCSSAPKPDGNLIYCSCAQRGAAGLGSDYCELIADQDSIPRIVVVLNEGNRFEEPVIRREYAVAKETVDSLSTLLLDAKVYKLDGYSVDEPITGGYSYRIYMEYSSGDKVNAFWYGNKIEDKAIEAYNLISNFFSPWREQAFKDGMLEQLKERVTQMEILYDKVSGAVARKKAYPELHDDVLTLSWYMDSGQWKSDFEADEKGGLPANLKKGVLSEDGLYNLLGNKSLHRLLRKK